MIRRTDDTFLRVGRIIQCWRIIHATPLDSSPPTQHPNRAKAHLPLVSPPVERERYTTGQSLQKVTRGQWPYRPAATRAMKNENMLLYANFASNGSVNQPLPVGLLLLTYRQLLSAAACSSFVECRVPSPLDPFFLPLWPPAASEKRRERCTLAQKDRQTHGRTSNSMTTAAPPSFLLSLSLFQSFSSLNP